MRAVRCDGQTLVNVCTSELASFAVKSEVGLSESDYY